MKSQVRPRREKYDRRSKSEEWTRRIQCSGETIWNSSGWSWWVGRRGLVWQWPNRRPRKEPRSLSSPAMRNEFRRPLSVSVAKHRGRRSTSRTKEALQLSLRNLAVSIIWYSPPEIVCICANLLRPISNRPDAPLRCAIWPHSPESSTEDHLSARRVLSFSQPELPASARKKDG